MPVERLVLRYLAAFGPATVRDAQTWSGLTRLGEVVDRLRPSLEVFAGAAGGELFDLPGAPRPGEDVPAPVRFLYDYDNLLLSHADRARVLGGPAAEVGAAYPAHGYTAESNLQPAGLLVDGVVAGTWRVTRSAGRAVLAVRGFAPFSGADGAEIEAEGAALPAFLHPRDTPEIRRA